MTKNRLQMARWLVAVPALLTALIPPLADLNATHVTNPLWTGHARLHTVWLLCTNSTVSLLALGVLWQGAREARVSSVRVAAALVGAVLLGFFVAAASQGAYGGSLTDPNGIPFRFGPVDANLATFSVCAVLVAAGAWLAREPTTGEAA